MSNDRLNRRQFLQTSALGPRPRPASSRRPPCCARRARPSRSASCSRCPARCPIRASRAASARRSRSRRSTRRRHQVARRRQDRSGDRRRAIDAGRRQRRSREDERGRRRGDRRRLCLVDLPRHDARPRRATTCPTSSTSASTDAIVTRGLKNTFRFGPGFGVIAKTAIDNLDHAQRRRRQDRQDRDDRARGFGLRLGPRQAAQHAASRKKASR